VPLDKEFISRAWEVKLPELSRLSYLYLAYLSSPKAERHLYRHIRRQRVARIVEIGIGSLQRTLRMLRVAAQPAGSRPVQYAGIDAYDARPDGMQRLSLKETYRRLRATGAQVRLVPGDTLSSLARTANVLSGTDLVIVSADQEPAAMESAWFYLPRMLHEGSLVLQESGAGTGRQTFRPVEPLEVHRRARTGSRRRAA